MQAAKSDQSSGVRCTHYLVVINVTIISVSLSIPPWLVS